MEYSELLKQLDEAALPKKTIRVVRSYLEEIVPDFAQAPAEVEQLKAGILEAVLRTAEGYAGKYDIVPAKYLASELKVEARSITPSLTKLEERVYHELEGLADVIEAANSPKKNKEVVPKQPKPMWNMVDEPKRKAKAIERGE